MTVIRSVDFFMFSPPVRSRIVRLSFRSELTLLGADGAIVPSAWQICDMRSRGPAAVGSVGDERL
jgi:hypothetical protein